MEKIYLTGLINNNERKNRPECGSTSYNHMSWCRIHETPAIEYEKKTKTWKRII